MRACVAFGLPLTNRIPPPTLPLKSPNTLGRVCQAVPAEALQRRPGHAPAALLRCDALVPLSISSSIVRAWIEGVCVDDRFLPLALSTPQHPTFPLPFPDHTSFYLPHIINTLSSPSPSLQYHQASSTWSSHSQQPTTQHLTFLPPFSNHTSSYVFPYITYT